MMSINNETIRRMLDDMGNRLFSQAIVELGGHGSSSKGWEDFAEESEKIVDMAIDNLVRAANEAKPANNKYITEIKELLRDKKIGEDMAVDIAFRIGLAFSNLMKQNEGGAA